ncbi:MAG: oligosaccharide flippase family protein [Gemmatimonadota bacterium]|nr:oligosaccharide flippase family protein [Gemmatimonadota bacterium]
MPDKDRSSTFFNNTVITLFTRVLTALAGFSISVILSRRLGPQGRGGYALLTTFPMLVTDLFSFGMGAANTYLVGRYKDRLQAIACNAFVVSMIMGIPTALIISSAVYWEMFDAVSELDTTGFYFVVFLIPLLLLFSYLAGVLLGLQELIKRNLLIIIQTGGVAAVLTLAFFLAEVSLGMAVVTWGISWCVVTALAMYWIYRRISFRVTLEKPLLKEGLRFGIKNYFGQLALSFTYRLDIFIIGYLLETSAVGYYVVAVSFAEIGWYISHATGFVLFPTIASSEDVKNDRMTILVAKGSVLATLAFAICWFILGDWLIIFFYGGEFSPAILPLHLLLPGIVIGSIPRVLNSHLMGKGYPGIGAYSAFFALITMTALDFLLVPVWGIAGAAVASSIAYTVYAAVILRGFLLTSGQKLTDMIIRKSDIVSLLRVCRVLE